MNNAFRVPSRPQGTGMPEYRQQTTGPQAGANVSARLEDRGQAALNHAVQAGLAQAGRNADMQAREWEQFNRGLQGFLRSGLSLYNDYRDKTSRALVSEAMMTAREQMEAWRTEYDKAHMGGDGLQAAQDYQKEWERLYGQHMKALREKGVSGPYEHMANMQFRESGLHYNAAGQRFQEQQDRAWNDSVLKGMEAQIVREAQNNPDDVAYQGLLLGQYMQQWQRLHPGLDGSAVQQGMAQRMAEARIGTMLAAGDTAAAQQAVNLYGGGRVGDRVAVYESGKSGVNAIGYDRNGGTSYGKYQLSSKQGSYQEWLDYLGKQGAEGAAIAGRLKATGGFNTGSRSGAAVDAYKKEAEANPELFERTQREYIEKTHYNPMLAKLPPEERAMIEGNAGLQEMAWSVAVQHGGAGGAKLLARAWKKSGGMSPGDLVDAVYDVRGGNFGSSTLEVQASVRSRFGRERNVIHGMLGGGVLPPDKAMHYQRQIDAMNEQQRREAEKQAVDGFLAETRDMATPERLQRLNQQYGDAPEKRQMYDAILRGIRQDAAAQEAVQQAERKARQQEMYTQAEACARLPEAEGWKKAQEYRQTLPLDEREQWDKTLHKVRNPAAKDDPLAVEVLTQRMANGEDVNMAEYAGRITPATAKKFTNQQFRAALPVIKAAFDDAANVWLGEKRNKNNAGELGLGNKQALWTRFLNSTDADEKGDVQRLRREAQEFFKAVTLERGWFGIDVETIRGLEPGYMGKYADARPKQGTEEYGIVTGLLQKAGIEPDGVSGKYSDEQLAQGYRQWRTMMQSEGQQ